MNPKYLSLEFSVLGQISALSGSDLSIEAKLGIILTFLSEKIPENQLFLIKSGPSNLLKILAGFNTSIGTEQLVQNFCRVVLTHENMQFISYFSEFDKALNSSPDFDSLKSEPLQFACGILLNTKESNYYLIADYEENQKSDLIEFFDSICDLIQIIGRVGNGVISQSQLPDRNTIVAKSLEISKSYYWNIDLMNGTSEYSPAFYELLALPTNQNAQKIDFWLKFIHPDDLGNVIRSFSNYIQGKTREYTAEYRLLTPYGQNIWLSSTGKTLLSDNQGNPLIIVGMLNDITVRKDAEQQILSEQFKLREILNNLPIAVGIHSLDGKNEFQNQAFATLFGYTLEEIPDIPTWGKLAYPDPEYRKQVFDLWDNDLLKLKHENIIPPLRVYRVNIKGGGIRIIEVGFRIFGNQNLVIFNDVTEKHQIFNELKISQERLAFALEATSDGLWDWNLKTNLNYYSPRWYTMLGYLPNEFEPTYENWSKICHPGDLKMIENHLIQYLNKEVSDYEVEFRVKSKDNQWIWMLGRGKTVEFDTDGTAIRLVGTNTDISRRKLAEEEALLARQNLEEMIYIASHDLLTPLVSIEGYTSELIEKFNKENDDEAIVYLQRLKVNASRMYALVQSLLDISRLNTRKLPYENFKTQIIIKKIMLDHSLLIEKQKVNISIGILPAIKADFLRIEGVFRNLIVNAIYYGAKNVEIGYSDNLFFVKDDGIGIPLDQLDRIFKPGERLKIIKTEGIGMGLTFCKKVIQQHGGRIWANSDGDHKGSIFYIEFPADILAIHE